MFWMSTDDFAHEFRSIHVCLSDQALSAQLEKRKDPAVIKMRQKRKAETRIVSQLAPTRGATMKLRKSVRSKQSGRDAPSVAHMPEQPWILHFGELSKKSGVQNDWRETFCCLHAVCLKYYSHEGRGGELIGIVQLDKSTVARPSLAPSACDNGRELELVSSQRTYRFNAKCREDRDAWLHKLRETIVALGTAQLKESLSIEEGGKAGGKFGRWKTFHFAIREAEHNGQEIYRLLVFDNIANENSKYFQAQVKKCIVPPSPAKLRPIRVCAQTCLVLQTGLAEFHDML